MSSQSHSINKNIKQSQQTKLESSSEIQNIKAVYTVIHSHDILIYMQQETASQKQNFIYKVLWLLCSFISNLIFVLLLLASFIISILFAIFYIFLYSYWLLSIFIMNSISWSFYSYAFSVLWLFCLKLNLLFTIFTASTWLQDHHIYMLYHTQNKVL